MTQNEIISQLDIIHGRISRMNRDITDLQSHLDNALRCVDALSQLLDAERVAEVTSK